MKKICLIIALIFLISLWKSPTTLFFGSGTYTFYIGSASSLAQMVSVDSDQASKLRKSLKNVEGESLAVNDLSVIESELERYKATLVFEEVANGVVCKYYYSNLIKNYKLIKGQRINIQTAINGSLYTIGSPLIFGSY